MSVEMHRLQFLLDRTSLIHGVVNRWRSGTESKPLAQASMMSWRAMRSIAGLLYGHPNLRFHPAPFQHLRLSIRIPALLLSLVRTGATARTRWLASNLQMLSRMIADARSATVSLEVSQALGRAQIELHHLLADSAQPSRRPATPIRPSMESPYLVA